MLLSDLARDCWSKFNDPSVDGGWIDVNDSFGKYIAVRQEIAAVPANGE